MTDEAMVEAVARAICKADGNDPDAPIGGADRALQWVTYRHEACAAIRALAPLIVERCAEMADRQRSEFVERIRDAGDDVPDTALQLYAGYAYGASSLAVDIRALIQEAPSCAPAGVTSPPR